MDDTEDVSADDQETSIQQIPGSVPAVAATTGESDESIPTSGAVRSPSPVPAPSISITRSPILESMSHIDPLLRPANASGQITRESTSIIDALSVVAETTASPTSALVVPESVSNVDSLLDTAETTTHPTNTPAVTPAIDNSGHDAELNSLLIHNAFSSSAPPGLPAHPTSMPQITIPTVQLTQGPDACDPPDDTIHPATVAQPSTDLSHNLKDNPKAAWIPESIAYLRRLEVGPLWSQTLNLWLKLERGLQYPNSKVCHHFQLSALDIDASTVT